MWNKIIRILNTILYGSVSILLILFALMLIYSSLENLYVNIFLKLSEENLILAVLQSAWSVIIAAAITDVAKYMYEEEVRKSRLDWTLKLEEARETLTKIVIIISIAVSIEWLIYIFKAWLQDIKLLIYPALLIISSTTMIVWLWIYHKLTLPMCQPNNRKNKD